MGHIVEVQHMTSNPTGLKSITKINKDQYIDIVTGELKEYKHSQNRAQNVAGLKHTFAKIRRLINNNFFGNPNELFITLTYAENMTDPKQLYRDFVIFWKRLKRRHPYLEYLVVVEPQARGAWHCHVLVKDPSTKNLYIPNDEISKLWEHGFTSTKRLKSDDIGSYLTAYLADILVEEYAQIPGVPDRCEFKEVLIPDENGKKVKKTVVKGGRCYLYPPGMNIYRKSKGIQHPSSEYMDYGNLEDEIEKIAGDTTPDYSTMVELSDDDGQPLNTISYFQFNLKRHKKQEGKSSHDDTGHAGGISDRSADEGKHP